MTKRRNNEESPFHVETSSFHEKVEYFCRRQGIKPEKAQGWQWNQLFAPGSTYITDRLRDIHEAAESLQTKSLSEEHDVLAAKTLRQVHELSRLVAGACLLQESALDPQVKITEYLSDLMEILLGKHHQLVALKKKHQVR